MPEPGVSGAGPGGAEQPPRVAVITGASRGIGAHLAAAFAAAGYVVAGCSRSGERAPDSGGAVEMAAVDVTDWAAVTAFVEDVIARHGRIDVLVNNAGVIDGEVELAESDPEDWWHCVEVDVRGPYLLTRAVLPGMLATGSGRIVNLNSGAGTRPGTVSSAYHVAKTALARITGSVHESYSGAGVFAFDLMPGVVRTDMTRSMRAHDDRTEWTDPDDVAELALALASGRLDAWSGRFVRAGADTVEALAAAAPTLAPRARTLDLTTYGPGDPVA